MGPANLKADGGLSVGGITPHLSHFDKDDDDDEEEEEENDDDDDNSDGSKGIFGRSPAR